MKHQMKRLLCYVTVVTIGAAWCGVLPASAGDFVRVDFSDELPHAANGGVFGEPILLTGFEDPDDDLFDCGGEPFDLVDLEDDPAVCSPDPSLEGVTQSDLSRGGRWMLSTVGGESAVAVRTVGIAFFDTDTTTDDADCAGLAALDLGGELGGASCSCSTPCFVQARMTADRLFKKSADRQAFSINVLAEEPPGGGTWPPHLAIDYVNPLYICSDADQDVRWLQTESCDGSVSVAEAEVEQVLPPDWTSTVPLGRWDLPLKVKLRRVEGSGDGGGGGGGGCTLLPKGATCSEGGECCSGKCSGKPGARTCK